MGVICMVVCMSLLAILSFCLSIAEIVMGSVYLRSCSLEHYIPIYLVVSGCVGVILAITSGTDAHKTHKKAREDGGGDGEASRLQGGGVDEFKNQSTGDKCWSSIRGMLSLFAFIWMIVGMYWVLHVYKPQETSDPTSPLYCNSTLYSFALAMVFIRLALIIAMLVVTVCVCCGLICCVACMG